MELEIQKQEAKRDDQCWKQPQEGCIKVKTDAALSNKAGRVEWGITTKNWQDKVIATWAYLSKGCSSAKLEEALALRAAMIRAKQQG